MRPVPSSCAACFLILRLQVSCGFWKLPAVLPKTPPSACQSQLLLFATVNPGRYPFHSPRPERFSLARGHVLIKRERTKSLIHADFHGTCAPTTVNCKMRTFKHPTSKTPEYLAIGCQKPGWLSLTAKWLSIGAGRRPAGVALTAQLRVCQPRTQTRTE